MRVDAGRGPHLQPERAALSHHRNGILRPGDVGADRHHPSDSVGGRSSHGLEADAVDAWERVAPSDALDATWRLIRDTNAYLEANEPWKATPGPAVDLVLGDALEVLRIVAVLVSPALVQTAPELWRRLGLPGAPASVRVPDGLAWGGYPGGLPVEKGAPLFPRLAS